MARQPPDLAVQRPGAGPFTARTPRVVAARRLLRRRYRDETGRFLVEGPQAVREALAAAAVEEVFATLAATRRHPELTRGASIVTDDAVAVLAETVTPQGLVAVCAARDVPLDTALARRPSLVTVLAGIRDPGNAGTVLRTADAAGSAAVVFAAVLLTTLLVAWVSADRTVAARPRRFKACVLLVPTPNDPLAEGAGFTFVGRAAPNRGQQPQELRVRRRFVVHRQRRHKTKLRQVRRRRRIR